jgi:hypothetical protein
MKLTKEQIKFLDDVCYEYWKLNSTGEVDVDGSVNIRNKGLTEIPVKFGRVEGDFNCSYNKLTTLKNCPNVIGDWLGLYCKGNTLTDYFKNIKEEDFHLWGELNWFDVLQEYPFLVNIGKKYLSGDNLRWCLDTYPQIKLYLE